jgi:hypothetical protein
MKDTPEALDQMLDLYNDTLRVLSALPLIHPEISPDMREALLSMDPAVRRQETEWLKAHHRRSHRLVGRGSRCLRPSQDTAGRRGSSQIAGGGKLPPL